LARTDLRRVVRPKPLHRDQRPPQIIHPVGDPADGVLLEQGQSSDNRADTQQAQPPPNQSIP
jgi:hypothetical protein